MELNLCVPCLFGLEGPVASELSRLGMENVKAENGRVLFSGSERSLVKANLCLRMGERVLLEVGRTCANDFTALFDGVRAMNWENYIPMNGQFPVKGHSLNSALHSIPDCQRIVKKAIADRLGQKYHQNWLTETGEVYQVQFAIMNDKAVLYLDTSGTGLHKRGYRPVGNAAPLRETLAAAMVTLSGYRGRDHIFDPFCGSGTIPIEAALIARNIAPGLYRPFAAQKWCWIKPNLWEETKQEAHDREYRGSYSIWGGDVDPACVAISKANAMRAGVGDIIRFEVADAREFAPAEPGVIISNPPYGERVMEHAEAERLYRQFGRAYGALSGWKAYLLSSHTEFERCFGKKADKKRKLYNGMIKCDLYMYTR